MQAIAQKIDKLFLVLLDEKNDFENWLGVAVDVVAETVSDPHAVDSFVNQGYWEDVSDDAGAEKALDLTVRARRKKV